MSPFKCNLHICSLSAPSHLSDCCKHKTILALGQTWKSTSLWHPVELQAIDHSFLGTTVQPVFLFSGSSQYISSTATRILQETLRKDSVIREKKKCTEYFISFPAFSRISSYPINHSPHLLWSFFVLIKSLPLNLVNSFPVTVPEELLILLSYSLSLVNNAIFLFHNLSFFPSPITLHFYIWAQSVSHSAIVTLSYYHLSSCRKEWTVPVFWEGCPWKLISCWGTNCP